MSETVERIYPEALNLRSVAKMERKKGNVELAHVIEGAADLYERTASDVDSATKALNAHSAVVIDQHEEIASLRAQLDEARAGTKGCMAGVTGTSVDPERPSCLRVHFDHPVTDSDRERIRNAHNTIVRLASELAEARRKAIEGCIEIASAFENPYVPPSDLPYGKGFIEGQNSTVTEIVKSFRALLTESKT